MNDYTPVKHKYMGSVDINPFWDGDCKAKQHMTMIMRLDHEIDGSELLTSFEETLNVWPLLKDSFIVEDDGIYFVENKSPIKVHKNTSIVAPGEGLNDNRLLAVSYNGDIVSFSGMHSYFDGGSVLMLVKGTICRYLKLHYNHDLEVGHLITPEEGNRPENYDYYAFRQEITDLPFERKEPIPRYYNCFNDPKMVCGANEEISLEVITMPADQFMSLCKSNGSNPSVMLFIIFAKAAYAVNQDLDAPITANNTINIRHMVGMDAAIMGQTIGSDLALTKEKLENMPLPELVRELRDMLNIQRSRDYILSRTEEMRNGVIQADYKPTVTLAYMGELNYGECTRFIKEFTAYNDSVSSINMLELHGNFNIFIQLGQASSAYAASMNKILNELGVSASITSSIPALPDEVRQ